MTLRRTSGITRHLRPAPPAHRPAARWTVLFTSHAKETADSWRAATAARPEELRHCLHITDGWQRWQTDRQKKLAGISRTGQLIFQRFTPPHPFSVFGLSRSRFCCYSDANSVGARSCVLLRWLNAKRGICLKHFLWITGLWESEIMWHFCSSEANQRCLTCLHIV